MIRSTVRASQSDKTVLTGAMSASKARLTQYDKEGQKTICLDARGLLSGLYSANGIGAYKQEQLLGPGSLAMRATRTLENVGILREGYSDTTIAKDRTIALELLDKEHIRLIAGQKGSIILDGGSLNNTKAMVVLFKCNDINGEEIVVVINIYKPDAEVDEVYDFKKIARDVRAACDDMHIDIPVCGFNAGSLIFFSKFYL